MALRLRRSPAKLSMFSAKEARADNVGASDYMGVMFVQEAHCTVCPHRDGTGGRRYASLLLAAGTERRGARLLVHYRLVHTFTEVSSEPLGRAGRMAGHFSTLGPRRRLEGAMHTWIAPAPQGGAETPARQSPLPASAPHLGRLRLRPRPSEQARLCELLWQIIPLPGGGNAPSVMERVSYQS